jgi:hypothetical protein
MNLALFHLKAQVINRDQAAKGFREMLCFEEVHNQLPMLAEGSSLSLDQSR